MVAALLWFCCHWLLRALCLLAGLLVFVFTLDCGFADEPLAVWSALVAWIWLVGSCLYLVGCLIVW